VPNKVENLSAAHRPLSPEALEKVPEFLRVEKGDTLGKILRDLGSKVPEVASSVSLSSFIRSTTDERKKQGGVRIVVRGQERLQDRRLDLIYEDEMLPLREIVRGAQGRSLSGQSGARSGQSGQSGAASDAQRIDEPGKGISPAVFPPNNNLKVEKLQLKLAPEQYPERGSMNDRKSRPEAWIIGLASETRSRMLRSLGDDGKRPVSGAKGQTAEERDFLPSMELLCAIATRETHRRPDQIGNPGGKNPCIGLMQVTLPTAQSIEPSITQSALMRPEKNVEIAAKVLSNHLRDIFAETGTAPDSMTAQTEAVARYNAGKRAWTVLQRPTAVVRVKAYLEEVFSGVDYWREKAEQVRCANEKARGPRDGD